MSGRVVCSCEGAAEFSRLDTLVASLSREVADLGGRLANAKILNQSLREERDLAKENAKELKAEVAKLKRQMDNLYFAYDRLRQEKTAETELWKGRAEAMASEKTDSDFNADQVEWRKKAVKALEANGWKSPVQQNPPIPNVALLDGVLVQARPSPVANHKVDQYAVPPVLYSGPPVVIVKPDVSVERAQGLAQPVIVRPKPDLEDP